MRILVAGCGYVGARLAEERALRGDTVFALRRSAVAAPSGTDAVRADLGDPTSLRALPAVDAVVFAPTPDTRDDAGYRRTYVEGATHLAEALARQAAPVRWIQVSSTSVFEVEDGAWVSERTPCPGSGFRAARLLESEAAAARYGHRAVSLRLGGIYGPGRDGLLRRVATGQARIRNRYTNRIHRDDAAGAIGHLLDLADPQACYVGVDADPALDRVVVDWLAARLGVAAVPGEREGEPGGKRCRSDRLVASGFAFRYPSYVEGYDALIGEGVGHARDS